MPPVLRSVLAPLVVAVLAAGCGSSGGTTDPPDGGSISISLSKTTLTAQQGGSDNLTATISRNGGFTGTVTITTEGAPAGVTAEASNVTTSGTTTTGTITVTVGPSVAPGTYNLTVRATGSGVTAVTQAVTLTVTPAPAIALTLNPTSLSVVQGASGTTAVTIARTAFTGAVTLALEGAPAGVVGSFDPAAPTANGSTLTVQVGAAVAAGTYNLTVRGTGTGVTAATAALTLTVTAVANTYALALSPTTATTAAGTSADVTVTVNRNGFQGTVNLTAEGLPSGVTASFAPAAVTGTTSTLTLQVGAGVAPGNYNLTVKGTAGGQSDKTAPLTLTVTAPASYTLSTTPATSVSLQQGAQTNVTVNLNRTGGFAGSVTLAVTGAPAGLTAGLNPTSTTGNSSTLTIQAAGNLTTGNYPLTITGTASGQSNKTVQLTVTVTSGGGGSGSVSLDFTSCLASVQPIWLAYQDGSNGAWTAVTGSGNVFAFTASQSKVGVAWVTTSSGRFITTIQYYTQAELQAFAGGSRCPAPPATKMVLATQAGVGATQQTQISIGGGTGFGFGASAQVQIPNVKSGTFDVVGFLRAQQLSLGTGDKMLLRRDVNTTGIADGGSLGPALDFAGSEAFDPASATITVTGAGTDNITHIMNFLTGASCEFAPLYNSPPSTGTITAYGAPAGKMRGNDYHALIIVAQQGFDITRTVFETVGTLTNHSVALPGVIGAFTPTTLAGPYKRLRFTYTMPTGAAESTTATYVSTQNDVMITATSGYLGGTAVDLSMPDFSSVTGWNNSWGPPSGAGVSWNVASGGGVTSNGCTIASGGFSRRGGSL